MLLFPTRQLMIAAGATLCTEQSTPVNPSPSFHSALELMVLSGRAAWERGVENSFFVVEKDQTIFGSCTRPETFYNSYNIIQRLICRTYRKEGG